MRTRQSPYEIVADCSNDGGYWYQALDHFILREVLACGKNGVETEKNKDKSSGCDISVILRQCWATCVFSAIQLTKPFIKFVVKTNCSVVVQTQS